MGLRLAKAAAVTLAVAGVSSGLAGLAQGDGGAATSQVRDGRSNEHRNMQLIGRNNLGGGVRGATGEGMAEVRASGGRRILYVANESGPVCFSVVDVTRPRRMRVLSQIPAPGPNTRCNSLDASGNKLVVANQVSRGGQGPAGFQVYDIRNRTRPRPVGYFDTSGPFSRGVHYVWIADGRYVHMSTGMPDFQPRRPGLDDQIYVIADIQNPAQPREVGRWWLPGTREGDAAPLPKPNRIDSGCRAHNVLVYPSQPNRAYLAYIDCGIVVLDISNKANPRVIRRVTIRRPSRASRTR